MYQTLKPYPQYSNVARAFDQSATTFFNAFQVQADKHMSNNLNFLASIMLPTLYDNMDTAVNKYNPAAEWAEDAMGSFESKIAPRISYRSDTANAGSIPAGQVSGWMVGKYRRS